MVLNSLAAIAERIYAIDNPNLGDKNLKAILDANRDELLAASWSPLVFGLPDNSKRVVTMTQAILSLDTVAGQINDPAHPELFLWRLAFERNPFLLLKYGKSAKLKTAK